MSDMVSCLRELVAEVHGSALCAREAHWNVRGVHFGPLHSLFGDAYTELAEIEDVLAERVRALGALLPATLPLFAKVCAPESLAKKSSDAMVQQVLGCYQKLSKCLCEAIATYDKTDPVTVNILQDLCARLDKRAWMLRMLTIKEK